MSGAPTVVPYSSGWPALFGAERERVADALAPWLVAGIHHIGSTAVPGLAAKPVIDMLAGVASLERARAAFGALDRLGYEYRPHRPEAHLFAKHGYNVHLTEPGSDLWRERLAFRDALRADRELARAYAGWKLAHVAPDLTHGAYTADKRPFVQSALRRVGITLAPDEVRLAPEALEARRRA